MIRLAVLAVAGVLGAGYLIGTALGAALGAALGL